MADALAKTHSCGIAQKIALPLPVDIYMSKVVRLFLILVYGSASKGWGNVV